MGAGEIGGSRYRSLFFRFTYMIPEKFNPETIKTFREKIQTGLKSLSREDKEKYERALQEVDPVMTLLLSTTAAEFENNLKAAVTIHAFDLSSEPEMQAKELLQDMMESFQGEGSFAYLSPIQSQRFGGKDFEVVRYRFEKVVGGKRLRFYTARCLSQRKPYALVWQFTAGSEKTLDRLVRSLESLQFQD